MSKLTKFFNSPLLYIADGIYKRKGLLSGNQSNKQKMIPNPEPIKKKVKGEVGVVKKTTTTQNKENSLNLREEHEAMKLKASKNTKKTEVAQNQNEEVSNMKVEDISYSNIRFRSDVAVYFDGKLGNIYQIEQWLLPLKELQKYQEIVFIVRTEESYDWIRRHTDFPVVLCKLLNDVMSIYERSNFKCVLYVNNAMRNFQSLIISNAFHIHINHGESDKISTISNQAKAYDYVAIVGQAAYDKYNNNLMHKDMGKFVQIGRPQLEHIHIIPMPFPDINKEEQKVILYAPTWEATHETMNYTSLDDYGLSIVETILNNPNYFLIYKPHPNTGNRKTETDLINKSIIKFISNHERGRVFTSGDINSLYSHIDLAIFDNSAVAIDYLAVDKPMLMNDMFYKTPNRQDSPIIIQAARMLRQDDIMNLEQIIQQELKNDTLKIQRQQIKEYYLGQFDYINKESTQAFISFISDLCIERDKELLNLQKNQKKIF